MLAVAESTTANYINYHRQVLVAESLLFIGKFEEGIAKYREIFSAYKPFAKDCFIALQISAMREDTSSFRYFLVKGIACGINWSTLNKSEHIRNFLRERKAERLLLEQIYSDKRPKYIQSINRTLRDSIYLLRRRDDSGRMISRNNMTYSNHIYYTKDPVLDENINILAGIAKRHGYPGQRMIGIKDPEIDSVEESPILLESLASVILYHHYCGFFLMKNELYNGLLNGEILPAEYALIYEWAYEGYYQSKGQYRGSNNRFIFTTKCDYPEKDKFYNHYLNPFFYCKDTLLVNSCRKEIGMQSIQHQFVKQKFAERNDLILSTGFLNLY